MMTMSYYIRLIPKSDEPIQKILDKIKIQVPN